jgi:signal transduction histidine kinase/DNA-binding NarL/FixJ family response regulator
MAKILIVDDRPTNRQFLLTLLGYTGHRLFEAADGAEALDRVRAEHPDLVITDILMPTMDGYEFVQELRADPDIASTRVIFYTATYSTPEAQLLAKTCGVDTVLRKPSDPEEILAAVSRELGASAVAGTPASEKGIEAVTTRGAALFEKRERTPPLSERFSGDIADLQRITSRLSTLVEVMMDMMSERDPARMVKKFFQAACRIIDSDYAAVGVLDEAERAVKHLFTKDVDEGVYDRSARTGLPGSLLSEYSFLRRVADTPTRGLEGFPSGHPVVREILGGPLLFRDRACGWIYFARKTGGARFSEEDERIAATMAEMLAPLYEHVTLYDAIQRHAAGLQIEVQQRKRAESEILRLNTSLERRVAQRTAALEAANRELEAFSFSVAHDLRAPLRHIDGFARMALDKSRGLDEALVKHLNTVVQAAGGMGKMIDGLLGLSRVGRAGLQRQRVDMAKLVEEARSELGPDAARPTLRWEIGALPAVSGDPVLLRIVWVNLLSNALKYSSRQAEPKIEVGTQAADDGKEAFFVRDNGVGFDMRYGEKLFNVFQRLHRQDEFEGIGIGLATVRRVIERHGGRLWAESKVNEGATFYFRIGEEQASTSGT